MAFLNQIDFNNLFNDETYFNASVDGPYSIRIAPTGGRAFTETPDIEIVGILKNNINFNVAAEWSTLGLDSMVSDLMGNNPILNAIQKGGSALARTGGTSLTAAGLVTKKFYKGGGGYLSIQPEFRVLDWENTGEVWAQFLALMTSVLPRSHRNIKIADFLNDIKDKSPDSIAAMIIKYGGEAFRKVATGALGESVGGDLSDNFQHSLSELGEGSLNLTESPSPVSVQIGNWFKHDDMVIESVSFDMSDKMTTDGPLFMDVSLTLSSREAMVLTRGGIDNMSFGTKSGGKRVVNQ